MEYKSLIYFTLPEALETLQAEGHIQDKKRALVQNLIATEASFFKSLTRDDVKMLFS